MIDLMRIGLLFKEMIWIADWRLSLMMDAATHESARRALSRRSASPTTPERKDRAEKRSQRVSA